MNTPAYATDEDIALRAPADFGRLCPGDQKIAGGSDGAFSPGARWTLTCPSAAFLDQGVAPGQIVRLTGPPAVFRAPGEAFAVDSAGAGAIVLRRKGQPLGAGQPPGPASGASGVEFGIATLAPQIARAGDELDRLIGLDGRDPSARATDRLDPVDVRTIVVLAVLHRRHLDLSGAERNGGDADAEKARMFKSELEEILARVAIRRGGVGPSTARFQTRIAR